MTIFAFLIGAILAACGLGSLALSLNLVPTEMGMLYAVSGVILVGCGGIALAIAALIARISSLSRPRPAPKPAVAPPEPVPVAEAAPAPAPQAAPDSEPEEEINFNRAGHLPSLHAVEMALAEPEASAKIVGRYTAGGAKYVIFADGSIEAETEDGAFRFASMGEFKSFVAGRRG